MSTRIQLTKDYQGFKKGDIVELRSAQAKQIIKAKAAVVQTDIGAESLQTKDVTNGNPAALRPNNRRRR